MALPHADPGARIDCRPLGDALRATPTHALLKTGTLELVRIVLAAGRALPAHRVSGEITVQCIEGRVWLRAEAGAHLLEAGDLVLLPGGDLNALDAVEDSSLLVTIVLAQAGAAASGATAAR
jgi:quercetin dioxygenase-like cupin family protein